MDSYARVPLSREEFDARCARLEALYPGLSCTSAVRSYEHNTAVGGKGNSRHLQGLARDYVHDYQENESIRNSILLSAKTLGLYGLWHGPSLHLHLQAVPPAWGVVRGER